jgi:hypothetical protein
VGSGVCPRAMRCVLRAEYVRCCSASYCMVCTARSGRLGKAPPRATATGCSEGWIGGWPQFQLLRNPATTKTSRDPSLSPTALLARCNPQDMAKCREHAARVLCLRKDRRLRLLTGCWCRPPAPSVNHPHSLDNYNRMLKRTALSCLEHSVACGR